MMRAEQLHKLTFADAFRDTLSMMALSKATTVFAESDLPRERKRSSFSREQSSKHCRQLPSMVRVIPSLPKNPGRRGRIRGCIWHQIVRYIVVMNLIEDIRSVTELKRKTREILDQVRRTGRPVVLTVNGKADAVLIDAKTYEKHLSASNMAKLLAPAELDVREGRTRSMRTFLR